MISRSQSGCQTPAPVGLTSPQVVLKCHQAWGSPLWTHILKKAAFTALTFLLPYPHQSQTNLTTSPLSLNLHVWRNPYTTPQCPLQVHSADETPTVPKLALSPPFSTVATSNLPFSFISPFIHTSQHFLLCRGPHFLFHHGNWKCQAGTP